MLKIRRQLKFVFISLIALAALLTVASSVSLADPTPVTSLENHYGDSNGRTANQVWQTNDRGFILVGTGQDPSGTGTNLVFVKTDFMSNMEWSKNIGGTSGYSVRQTADGGFIATGSHGNDLYLVKTDADGVKEWEKDFSNASGQSVGYSLLITSDGGYIILGQVMTGTGNWGMELLKTDARGTEQWGSYFSLANSDVRMYSVGQTSDGGYIVGGYKKGDASAKPFIVKADANGKVEWSRSYEGPGAQDSFLSDGFGIQQTRDGGYIYAGEHSSYTYLLKVDAEGNRQWDHDLGMTGANAVQQTWDGGYILAGYSTDTSGIRSAYVVRTDSGGNKLWDSIYRGIGYAEAYSVEQIGTGAYVFAGSTKANNNANNYFYLFEIAKDMTPVPNAKLVSDTIPDKMVTGHAYDVQVTLENTGTMPWTYQDSTTLGRSGDASKFGILANRTIDVGKVIKPGQTETFSFTMRAPAENGTYYSGFQMMWEGHNAFGPIDSRTIQVVSDNGTTSSATPAATGMKLPCLSSILLPVLALGLVTMSWTTMKKKGDP